MVKVPEYLKIGDTIGIVCPAGYMPYEKVEKCILTLKQWGYNVKVGKTVGNQEHYFSGTDELRLSDIQEMIDDERVKAILCARGGYGTGRIIDKINFKKFKKKPKWIIGFSDITILHQHLYAKYKIASMHAPMAGAFNEMNDCDEYIESLKNILLGKKAKYVCGSHLFNKKGKASGRLTGGNLTLLSHLEGTDSIVNTNNKILFIEDVGEYIYNIDRMLYQLKRSGKLEKVRGLIVGGFTEIKDTLVPFGKTAEEVIKDIVEDYTYPVCYNFPISHAKDNYALKPGIKYELIVGEYLTSLSEI